MNRWTHYVFVKCIGTGCYSEWTWPVFEGFNTRQAICVWHNAEAHFCNHCCSGKAISITYPECVFVTLGVQHAMRLRHVVMWTAPLYCIFPNYLINGTIFRKKLLNTKCVFWFSLQLLSDTFCILWRTKWDMITNVRRSSCKTLFILVRH